MNELYKSVCKLFKQHDLNITKLTYKEITLCRVISL